MILYMALVLCVSCYVTFFIDYRVIGAHLLRDLKITYDFPEIAGNIWIEAKWNEEVEKQKR